MASPEAAAVSCDEHFHRVKASPMFAGPCSKSCCSDGVCLNANWPGVKPRCTSLLQGVVHPMLVPCLPQTVAAIEKRLHLLGRQPQVRVKAWLVKLKVSTSNLVSGVTVSMCLIDQTLLYHIRPRRYVLTCRLGNATETCMQGCYSSSYVLAAWRCPSMLCLLREAFQLFQPTLHTGELTAQVLLLLSMNCS